MKRNTRLGYLGIDQWGNHFTILTRPRKELMKQIGIKHVGKMYIDLKDGKSEHIGYVVGKHWVTIYEIFPWVPS